MPPKSNPKPLTPSELLAENERLINIANRMLVNNQVTPDQYKALLTTSNTFVDLYIGLVHPTKP